jgi:hypothetical protein
MGKTMTILQNADVDRRQSPAFAALLARDSLDFRDLAALRRVVSGDHCLSLSEAEALFAFEASAVPKCSGWIAFFVETLTDFVVWQRRPTGILEAEQAHWLLGQAETAGTLGALAVLVNVLAEAERVPAWFVAAVRGRAARGLWQGGEAEADGALESAA